MMGLASFEIVLAFVGWGEGQEEEERPPHLPPPQR